MHPIQQLRNASIEAESRPTHQRMQAAHASPRCQHIRFNGQRCAAPALRAHTLCYFHHRATDPATYQERWLPFIEDATSLQIALARVQRLLLMDGFEFRRANSLLYSLQIACMNLNNLKAEQPGAERDEGDHSGKAEKIRKNGDRPDVAKLLAAVLAKCGNGHRKLPEIGNGHRKLPEIGSAAFATDSPGS